MKRHPNAPSSPSGGSLLSSMTRSLSGPALLLLNCLLWLVGIIITLGCLLIIFEMMPQRLNEKQTLLQITSDIVHAGAVWASVRTPTWTGLWFTKLPRGNFSRDLGVSAEEILREAKTILPHVESLKSHSFFRYFKVDLDKECPFWAREELCTSSVGGCSICECSEDQIPIAWKEKPIEHFVDRSAYKQGAVTPWRSSPAIQTDAEIGGTGEGDKFLQLMSGEDSGGRPTYVDLTLNRPGFTSFRGRNIWQLIYKDNCIRDPSDDPTALESTCHEADIFEKIISGLQTCIMVLAAEFNEPAFSDWPIPFSAASNKHHNKVLGTHSVTESQSVVPLPPRYRYSLDLFRWRVADHKDWMENLYLTFSVLLRTLCKVTDIITDCPCCTGSSTGEDAIAKAKLLTLVKTAKSLNSCSDILVNTPLFRRKHDLAMKQFQNISRILDCVECEKCRLHGKLKFTALQVALKASGDSPVASLERNEIIALINTIGYFGESILIIESMEKRRQALVHILLSSCVLIFASGIYLVRRTRRPVSEEKEKQE